MARPTFDTEKRAFLEAHRGKIPDPALYAASVSFVTEDTGSANHKMQSNPTFGLVSVLKREPESKRAEFMDWLTYYGYRATLHENEGMTDNVAYFKAITDGTWSLSGLARELGEPALADRLVARIAADFALRVLQVSPGPVRRITNHHLNEIGRAFLWVGDGPFVEPIPGFRRVLLSASKRGLVRAGGHANHVGELEDTENQSVAEALCLATAKGTVPKYAKEQYSAILERFGGAPYGLPVSVRVALAAGLDPGAWADFAKVRALLDLAAACQPRLRYTIIRYEDGSVYVVCWHLTRSSTGGKAVDAALADGTRYIGSTDSASRSSGADDPDVQEQVVIETADAFVCRRVTGPGVPDIAVPKPVGVRELYRIDYGGGLTAPMFKPRDSSPWGERELGEIDMPGPPTTPQPKLFAVGFRTLSDSERSQIAAATGRTIPAGSAILSPNQASDVFAIWGEEEGGPDRFVIVPKA